MRKLLIALVVVLGLVSAVAPAFAQVQGPPAFVPAPNPMDVTRHIRQTSTATPIRQPSVVADAPLCGTVDPPTNHQLGRFPHTVVQGQALSPAQLADMGLHYDRLTVTVVVDNYIRDARVCGGGYWRREVLHAGELVVRGNDGYIAYLVRCWNRIVERQVIIAAPPAPRVLERRPRALWRWLGEVIDWPFYRYDAGQ